MSKKNEIRIHEVLSDYFQDRWTQPLQAEQSTAHAMADWIVKQVGQQTRSERIQTLEAVITTWQACAQFPDAAQRYRQLKSALVGPWQGWQNRVLGVHWVPQIVVKAIPVPETTDRHRLIAGKHLTHAALVGSSFWEWKIPNTQKTAVPPQTHLILDSGFSAMVVDVHGYVRGLVLGLGDGAGGHQGDLREDRAISQTSFLASQYACRLLAAMKTAREAEAEMSEVIAAVGRYVQLQTAPFREHTTLLALRVFPLPDLERIEVVGFSIGDGQVSYWLPGQTTPMRLGQSTVWVDSRGQEATSLVPGAYAETDIQRFHQILPADGIFLACSDGGVEPWLMPALPLVEGTAARVVGAQSALWDEKALSAQLPARAEDPMTTCLAAIGAAGHARLAEKRAARMSNAEVTQDYYEQALSTLRAREDEAQARGEALSDLRRRDSFKDVMQDIQAAESVLTKSRLGDDVLWLAAAWPRMAPPLIGGQLRPTGDQKVEHKAAEAGGAGALLPHQGTRRQILSEKITQLSAELAALGPRGDPTVRALKEAQLAGLQKEVQTSPAHSRCPTILFEWAEKLSGWANTETPEGFLNREMSAMETIEALLEAATDAERHTLCATPNAFGETVCFRMISAAAYRVAASLMEYMSPETFLQTAGKEKTTILHALCGQRVKKGKADALMSLYSVVSQLRKKKVFQALFWQADAQGDYPLHTIVRKACLTQDTRLAQAFLQEEASPTGLSPLYLTDAHGNTVLHIALLIHAECGTALPMIKVVLAALVKADPTGALLMSVNRAGQTAEDLIRALMRHNPIWGGAENILFQQAQRQCGRRISDEPSAAGGEALEVKQRTLLSPLEMKLRALEKKQAERLILSKNYLMRPETKMETILEISASFPEPQVKANVLSVVDWSPFSDEEQYQGLHALFGRSFTTLTLDGFKIANKQIPRGATGGGATTTVWQALFGRNSELVSLTLTHAQPLTAMHILQLIAGCPRLETLSIQYTDFAPNWVEDKGLFNREAPIICPELRSLTLEAVSGLSKFACQAPKLTQLTLNRCPDLKVIHLSAPQLACITSQQLPQWSVLETADPVLKPLSQLLAGIKRVGRTAVLAPDEKGVTVLHHAAQRGNLPSVVWLLSQQLPINAADTEGLTPFLCAVSAGRANVVRYLLSQGLVDTRVRDAAGQTAWHLAINGAWSDLVRLFIDARMDPHVINGQAQTPLNYLRESREAQEASGAVLEPALLAIENQLERYLAEIPLPVALSSRLDALTADPPDEAAAEETQFQTPAKSQHRRSSTDLTDLFAPRRAPLPSARTSSTSRTATTTTSTSTSSTLSA